MKVIPIVTVIADRIGALRAQIAELEAQAAGYEERIVKLKGRKAAQRFIGVLFEANAFNCAGRLTLVEKKVRKLLTPRQFAACQKQGKPYVTIRVTARQRHVRKKTA